MTAVTRSRKQSETGELPLLELDINREKYIPYKGPELKTSKIFFDFKKGRENANESDIFEATEKYRLKRKLGFFKKINAFFISLPPIKVDKEALLYYMREKVLEINTDPVLQDLALKHYHRAHKKCLKIIYYKSNAEYEFSNGVDTEKFPNDRLEIVDIKGIKKTIRGRLYIPPADLANDDILKIKQFIVHRIPKNTYKADDIQMIDVKYDFFTQTEYSIYSENGQITRKFILKKSDPSHAASVLEAIGKGMIDLETNISPNLLPQNNNLEDIFADQLIEVNQARAIRIAYETCKKIVFYISRDGEQQNLCIIDSPHTRRAKAAGKIMMKAFTLVFAIFSAVRTAKH